MNLSRFFPLSLRHVRAFALFLGSAALAFASVWIAEKEFAMTRAPASIQMANAIQVQHQEDSQSLSHKLAPGLRAMSVRVNEVAGVAGFALPGSYVDILVNTQEVHASTMGNEQSISKIILEKVLVLAVAQETSHDDKKPKVVNAVTLQVTPEQSELLDLARNVGTLSLVLRNQADLALAPSSGVSRKTLLAGILSPELAHPHSSSSSNGLFSAATITPSDTQKIELIKGSDPVTFFSGKREGPR
jgi:Flp pilus assembly protein CpaB